MSKDIVNRFTGREYASDGVWDPANPSHLKDYFPKAGVKMSVTRCDVLLKNKTYKHSYGKVAVSSSPAKVAIEAAVYQVEGESLVAEAIELHPGQENNGEGALVMKEILTATELDKDKKAVAIKHTLVFSDGSQGIWTCK
jgi:hypothetical protein